MGAVHYSATELAEMVQGSTVGRRLRDHLNDCDQCHFLLKLVQRAQGEPSDEDTEVTLDALRRVEA